MLYIKTFKSCQMIIIGYTSVACVFKADKYISKQNSPAGSAGYHRVGWKNWHLRGERELHDSNLWLQQKPWRAESFFFWCQGQQINLEIRTTTRGTSSLFSGGPTTCIGSNLLNAYHAFSKSFPSLNEPQLLLSPCHPHRFLENFLIFLPEKRHQKPQLQLPHFAPLAGQVWAWRNLRRPFTQGNCPEKVDLWELLGKNHRFFCGKAATWYLFTCLSPKQLQRWPPKSLVQAVVTALNGKRLEMLGYRIPSNAQTTSFYFCCFNHLSFIEFLKAGGSWKNLEVLFWRFQKKTEHLTLNPRNYMKLQVERQPFSCLCRKKQQETASQCVSLTWPTLTKKVLNMW